MATEIVPVALPEMNGDGGLTLKYQEPDSSAALINDHIMSHPLVKSLIADSSYNVSRPHMETPDAERPHNLTSGVLLGEGRLPVPPLAFVKEDGSKYYCILYLGADLCGHPGFVHGGLLATILDEGLAGCCFPALPNHMGVTASLTLNFKRPCKTDQYVVIKAKTTKVEGKKAWVNGSVQTLVEEGSSDEPEIIVEAEALFIEPKGAAVKKCVDTLVETTAGVLPSGWINQN